MACYQLPVFPFFVVASSVRVDCAFQWVVSFVPVNPINDTGAGTKYMVAYNVENDVFS